eukprot:2653453-Amphidinium_carterae.1
MLERPNAPASTPLKWEDSPWRSTGCPLSNQLEAIFVRTALSNNTDEVVMRAVAHRSACLCALPVLPVRHASHVIAGHGSARVRTKGHRATKENDEVAAQTS